MHSDLFTRSFQFTFKPEDCLSHSFDTDILRLCSQDELPANHFNKVPKLVPSYTLMKYIELAAMLSVHSFLDNDHISLSYNFEIKPLKKISVGDQVDIVVTLKKKTRKTFYFEIAVYHLEETVAIALHTRFVTKHSRL
jgi:predicted thioesterase